MKKKKKRMPTPVESTDPIAEETPNAITTSAKKAAASGGKMHYIDNKKMLAVLSEYKSQVDQYKIDIKSDATLVKPRLPEYIGQCILDIAQRLSSKPNFVNYVHREEMIGDAIECCIRYVDNFDPAKSSNPFAYFTTVIFNAFIRRIEREKQHMYVKMKLVEKLDKTGEVRRRVRDENPLYNEKGNPYAEIFNLNDNDVSFWEQKAKKKSKIAKKVAKKAVAKKKKTNAKDGGLGKFFK